MILKNFKKLACLLLALGMPSIALTEDTGKVLAVKTPSVGPPMKVTPGTYADNKKRGQDQTGEKRKLITAEAVEAIRETQNALKALDDADKDGALKALERATGKLDLILARDPNLALAPNSVSEETYDLYADADKVRAARAQAEDLLVDGKIPEARQILDALRSETVISVSNIPLATYPDAIKKAVKFIDDGKLDKAKETLQTALDTLVVTDHIIPLPVVAAQDELSDAKKLSENGKRSADENKKLGELLSNARTHLEFAQALGYGTSQDFKDLYGELDTIKEKTLGGKSGIGFFQEIETSLDKVLESIQASNKPAKKV
jgi:hypothetical protein